MNQNSKQSGRKTRVLFIYLSCFCYLLLAPAGMFLVSCTDSVGRELTPSHIHILVNDQHPFLRDHGRECIISRDGTDLTRFKLYGDPGVGVHSNLYRNAEGNYVLVDINGVWYFINAHSGEMIGYEWHWMDPSPGEYLGTYQYDDRAEYRFVAASEKPEGDIYGFKDPVIPLEEVPFDWSNAFGGGTPQGEETEDAGD